MWTLPNWRSYFPDSLTTASRLHKFVGEVWQVTVGQTPKDMVLGPPSLHRLKRHYNAHLPLWISQGAYWWMLAVLGAAPVCAKYGRGPVPVGGCDDTLDYFWPELARTLMEIRRSPIFESVCIAATSRPLVVSAPPCEELPACRNPLPVSNLAFIFPCAGSEH